MRFEHPVTELAQAFDRIGTDFVIVLDDEDRLLTRARFDAGPDRAASSSPGTQRNSRGR